MGKPPVLVVEDDNEVRETMVELVSTFHVEARAASNGREALQLLDRIEPPCLILLDLSMPIMDGVEFRVRQLADPALSEIPVVLVSADAELREKALALRVAGALRKPVDYRTLGATIARYCAPLDR